MPRLQTRQALADSAAAAALAWDLVEYQDILYAPVDFETDMPGSSDPERTVWKRQTLLSIRRMANEVQDILFANSGEFQSFTFMLKQYSKIGNPDLHLLVPVQGQGVRRLLGDGTLSAPTGEFSPATLQLQYDPEVDTSRVWDMLCGWLDSEDQAKALLRHLSVGLQPSWTSGKYILFIGDGSNGKSLLLKMLYHLVGAFSVSQVKRQEMAANRPVIQQLNGAILNIVFDGPKKFVADSSTEKTLVVGEPLSLELKFENVPTIVQTNALFLEGLNFEPKSNDHSGGLHRRLERFHFPNKYEKDLALEARMLENDSLSALLKLILENWVPQVSAGKQLTTTKESHQLQVEQQWSTNPIFQYMEALAANPESLELAVAIGAQVDPFVAGFRSWADANGYRNYEEGYVKQLMEEAFVTARKTIRPNGKPTTRRVIVEWKPATQNIMQLLLKGTED